MPKFDLNQLKKKKIKILRKKYFYIENCLYLCTDESQKRVL